MSTSIVASVVGTASGVRDAHTGRALNHAVNEFIRVLGSVPDEPVDAVSLDDAKLIQSLGDSVIERIEGHVEDTRNASQAQALVSAIYEIRRLLEEVNRWKQHYTTARHS